MILVRLISPVLLSIASVLCQAQQYTISTFAGGSPPATPAAALEMPVGYTRGITADTAGNVYFISYNCVFRLDSNGVITRVAGNSRTAYSGDGGLATDAQMQPSALTVDAAGNMFILDAFRVRRVSPDGIIATVAGNGQPALGLPPPFISGDGGPALNAVLSASTTIAVDSAGNLFIAQLDRIRRVSADGIIDTVAGGGSLTGSSADDGLAINARLSGPLSIAADAAGNVYIAETYGRRIRKLSPDGILTTVAGDGSVNKVCVAGSFPDGATASQSPLCMPTNIVVDGAGNLFVNDIGIRYDYDPEGDYINSVLLKVSSDGTISKSGAPLGPPGASQSMALDGNGNLFFTDSSKFRISRLSPDGVLSTVAGNGECCYNHLTDAVPATSVQLQSPRNVAVDSSGNLFIVEEGVVRRVSPDGIATVLKARLNVLYFVSGVATDATGNLIMASGNSVFKLLPDGTITLVAGNGSRGDSGDGGPATSAQFIFPTSVAVDRGGNLFIADRGASRIRRVSPDGNITTYAGDGIDGFSGDGGPAIQAQIEPISIAVDAAGNLFVSDTSLYRIRKISPDGIINTIAGDGEVCSSQTFHGDGGPATRANCVNGALTVDSSGNVFTTAAVNRIRKISPDGIITTIAGTDGAGYSGDGGPATEAHMNMGGGGFSSLIAADAAGNLYIGDAGNNAVRILRPNGRSQ